MIHDLRGRDEKHIQNTSLKHLKRARCRWEGIIETDLKEMGCVGTDSLSLTRSCSVLSVNC
jgi:hypothetical protein